VTEQPLTPTEELILEVLIARYRLGEKLWTFSRRAAITRAAESLSRRGLVWLKNGMVEHSFQAGLTEKGLLEAQDPSYISPKEREWLKADPENIIEAVRRIVAEV